ncbi:hypothetical protein VHEMI01357 [[Torrubiella] hemipterigena]|uniref:Effector 5 n=1 Tax=[Torrubiella] hemipterigena TaxID=1531966 RepID=A0A0A1T577_9HYPO|nr:hypothetical protein VHEMI01357 [[Torrubiella] hemipterigena]
MPFSLSSIIASATLFGAALAAPSEIVQRSALSSRAGFDCSRLAPGLSKPDCEHMSKIGMAGQGFNPQAPNGQIWIGNQGPNKFVFTNNAAGPITVIVWNQPPGDFQSSFMNARRSQVSYSLAKPGQSVTVSIANGVSGGFAHLISQKTTLSQNGQVFNTWGEFTTGGTDATVDVSREVNMSGNAMSIKTPTCLSDMNTCVFTCKSGNTCGLLDSYNLLNCAPGSQVGANFGLNPKNQPEGGCRGFPNGGTIQVSLGK